VADKQSELCGEVLARMRKAGLLDELVLVGSWCLPAYRDYFEGTGRIKTLRTRDLDFLVPLPSKIRKRVDMVELLKDLGFILGHRGSEGFVILQHPELMVEFLVAKRGTTAVELPMLGMNAQPLRFLDIPMLKVMDATLHGVQVRVPHPASFALHKLLVAPRRSGKERRDRDAETGVHVLELLLAKGETLTIQSIYSRFPKSWRKVIAEELRRIGKVDLGSNLGILKQPR
jgi:hypothetical protein